MRAAAARQIETPADSARDLAQSGDTGATTAVYRATLEAAPYHVRVLPFLAECVLGCGAPVKNRYLQERTVEADPRVSLAYQSLGIGQQINGEFERVLISFDRTPALEPVALLT